MCREYAENELQRQWTAAIILILFSSVYLSSVFILFFCYHILWWNKAVYNDTGCGHILAKSYRL